MDLNSKSRSQKRLWKTVSDKNLWKMSSNRICDRQMNTYIQKSNARHRTKNRSSKHHRLNLQHLHHQQNLSPTMMTLFTCLSEVSSSFNIIKIRMRTPHRGRPSRNVLLPRLTQKPPWTILS